jgi:hypothetical protein
MILEAIPRSFEPLNGSTIWRGIDGLTILIRRLDQTHTLAVDHLAGLHDRNVNARAALGVDQLDSLRHRRVPLRAKAASSNALELNNHSGVARHGQIFSRPYRNSYCHVGVGICLCGLYDTGRSSRGSQASLHHGRDKGDSGVSPALRRTKEKAGWRKSKLVEVANKIGLAENSPQRS